MYETWRWKPPLCQIPFSFWRARMLQTKADSGQTYPFFWPALIIAVSNENVLIIVLVRALVFQIPNI